MASPRINPVRALSDAERERLEFLLDALPPPLEPPDLSALDGFLVGVLLQPRAVPRAQWLSHVHDLEAGPAPPGLPLAELHGLVLRRHAELAQAIGARQWFDPWVFDLEPESPGDEVHPADVVLPWVAGLAAALECFPELLANAGVSAREPLAVLYQHFDADDLDDADELRDVIDTLEPPTSVAEAVEDLVRCTLLLADESQSRSAVSRARPRR